MSRPLLDVHPVSFRACFPDSSHYQIVTTVLDHVLYNTSYKRKQILNQLKSEGLTSAVKEEILAVCREVLTSSDCPRAVHQPITTILVSRTSDASFPTPSRWQQPQSCTLVVTINSEESADRLWERVVSRLDQYTISRPGSTMVPPRRSRRLSIIPEPAASTNTRPAGRTSRTGRLASPARRPASPAGAPRTTVRRGRSVAASPPATGGPRRATRAAATPVTRKTSPAAKKTAADTSTARKVSPAARAARRTAATATTARKSAAATPAARKAAATAAARKAAAAATAGKTAAATAAARKAYVASPVTRKTTTPGAARKTAPARRTAAASPVSIVSAVSTVSRRSVGSRDSRQSAAASPPAAAAPPPRQTSTRRGRAATPPRKSSLSPAKRRATRSSLKNRSPSFAKHIHVRTLRGFSDKITDLILPDGLTESKSLLLDEMMANPTVVLETPGLLKRFSKKLKEAVPKAKSPVKVSSLPARSSAKSSPDAKMTRRRDSPVVSVVRVGGQTTRGSQDASAAGDGRESSRSAAERGRPSAVEKRARSESRSPSASPPKKTRVSGADPPPATTDSTSPESLIKQRVRPSLASVRKSLSGSLTAVPRAASSPASPVLRIHTPAVTQTTAGTVATTEASHSIQQPCEVVPAARPPRPPPALDTPERPAGVKTLLAARSSIRRRPADQPPPPPADDLSASPNLKPAREAAAAALSRAYGQLARSEAKQKDLFRSRLSGVATAASPALVRPIEKPAPEKHTAEDATAPATSKKSSTESRSAAQGVIEESPVKPTSKQSPESVPDKPAAVGAPDAAVGTEPVSASPAGGGTPRGQLALRSSVRGAPASALRRVLDRAPDSAAQRSSVRRVLRRPSPPPSRRRDEAGGGDSPLLEPPVTTARRAKLASELSSPTEGVLRLNSANAAGEKLVRPAITQLADETDAKSETAPPERRGPLRTVGWMLLLLILVVLGVLWLAGGQLPTQQQQQLRQLQQQGWELAQQLEQLVRCQTDTVRRWLGQQSAVPGSGH